MKAANIFKLLLATLTVFLVAGCEKDNPVSTGTPDKTDGTVTITNDDLTLEARMEYFDDISDLEIDTVNIPPGQLSKSEKTAAIKLRRRARVKPPKSGSTTLQATHVTLNGNYAYVSYNVQGATYLGGIDVFDVSNKTRPKLISQAVFSNADLNSIWYDNNRIYVTGSRTYDTLTTPPAFAAEFLLENSKLTLNYKIIPIASFAGTDIKTSGGKVWVTSGDAGGLSVLSQSTFTLLTEDPFSDARSVDVEGSTVVTMQGGPAQLRTYSASTNGFLSGHFIGGANIPESKSIVDVVLNRAFVACGDEGIKVFSLASNTIVDSLPRVTVGGISANLTVTNAVTVNDNLVFAANGEAGVYVAESSVNLESTPTVDPNLKYNGQIKFGSAESANFVASKNDLLFVATGLGGLIIVEIL